MDGTGTPSGHSHTMNSARKTTKTISSRKSPSRIPTLCAQVMAFTSGGDGMTFLRPEGPKGTGPNI